MGAKQVSDRGSSPSPVHGRARPWLPLAIVRDVRTRGRGNGKLIVESVAFGLGYTAVLIWSGAALVASFTDRESSPYWPAIPALRTDTTGVIAFAVAIVSLAVSKYLQLRRHSGAPAQPVARSSGVLAVQAMAETAAVPWHRLCHLPIPERRHASRNPAAPADASMAMAERGHRPGDRPRHLPGRSRHPSLSAGHHGPGHPGRSGSREGQRRRGGSRPAGTGQLRGCFLIRQADLTGHQVR